MPVPLFPRTSVAPVKSFAETALIFQAARRSLVRPQENRGRYQQRNSRGVTPAGKNACVRAGKDGKAWRKLLHAKRRTGVADDIDQSVRPHDPLKIAHLGKGAKVHDLRHDAARPQRRLLRRLPPDILGRPIADRRRNNKILARVLRPAKPQRHRFAAAAQRILATAAEGRSFSFQTQLSDFALVAY